MIKTKAHSWLTLAAALFCFTACGKKEDSASPQSVLSAPNAVEKVPAQAEVKSSSGPIELSLLIHKTQIKVGESLWQQLRIRNIGETHIVVTDRIFFNPRELRKQSSSRYCIYLEAFDPGGKPMKVEYQTSAHQGRDFIDGVSGLLEVTGPEEQAMLDGWKKQGLGLREINTKLIEFNTKKQSAAEAHQQPPFINLIPGESVETKSAFYYSVQDKIHSRPMPHPIGDFAQVDFFMLDEPGTYKIRAAYDLAPTKQSMAIDRKLHRGQNPEEVRFHTPWVSITVLP